MKYSIILLTVLLIVSCDNKMAIKQGLTTSKQNLSEIENIKTIDTTIVLKGIEESNYNGKNLTDSIAKEILYIYYNNKGLYNTENLPPAEKLTDSDIIVDFYKIYLAELNSSKLDDAIITYWLKPPFINGHCWQPHKAIISDTDKGYIITNVDFIPDNFTINSVLNQEGQTTIYSYEYDCSNNQILKYIKIKITQ